MNSPQRHGGTENHYDLTGHIIQCAITVHRALGPGLLEHAYEGAMCIEFDDEGLRYERQKCVEVYYKGRRLGEYHIDLIVQDLVVVEIKSVERTAPVFEAQILNYMRLSKKQIGLLLNFNSHLMKDGIDRFVL
jgi:GxxExxY protein